MRRILLRRLFVRCVLGGPAWVGGVALVSASPPAAVWQTAEPTRQVPSAPRASISLERASPPTTAEPPVAAPGYPRAETVRTVAEIEVAPAPPPSPVAAPLPASATSGITPVRTTSSAPGEFQAVFPRAEPAPGRKSFVDTTAAPCFARSADYGWIVGQLEYSTIRREWRLRYASVDETDRYGGRVALIETSHVRDFRDGMYVRVQGHVANPASTGSETTFYRIEAFEPIANPNAAPVPPARPGAVPTRADLGIELP